MTRKITLLLLLVPLFSIAQDDPTTKFGITFSGYVKTDFMIDTRQTFAPREGHFLLWPIPPAFDINGNDIHDGINTNFLPVQSQLSGKITGPDICGARTSGVLEGDFFGTTNATINLLRLRHAYMKLNWAHTELLMGQFWHPLFNPACFPATVSFNTGAPINPFSRDPQIRVSHTLGKFRLMASAVEQRDYPSYGPDGPSSTYLRNAAIPELYGEISYLSKNPNTGNSLQAGLLAGTKTLVPRITSEVGGKTYKVDETVSSKSASAYINLKFKPVTIKLVGIYGENLSDVLSITGFAMTGITDTITGHRSYAPTASMILWTDIHTNGAKWQAGLFAGINKGLGTTEVMANPQAPMYGLTYANKHEIPMLYRISPRIVYNYGRSRFAAEVEYTTATFGLANPSGVILRDDHGMPVNTDQITNIRCLLAAYYFF